MTRLNFSSALVITVASVTCLLYLKKRRSKRWVNRRWWCRPVFDKKEEQGDFKHLFQELKHDRNMFFRYTRMNLETFNKLLNLLQVFLVKNNWRAIPPEFRLIITLRYLDICFSCVKL